MHAYADPGRSCHLCGGPLVAGVCLHCDRPRPRWPVRVVSWVWLTRGRKLAALSFVAASVLAAAVVSAGVFGRESAVVTARTAGVVTSRSDAPSTPTEPAISSPSTFEILGYTDGFERVRRGYAFVIRSGEGSSLLLTDYHLVVADYMPGYRTVDLRRGDQTFTATIVAVNPDPHVALLRIRGVYPALPISPLRPRPGATATVGEPGSGIAERAAVLDYSGPGGDNHIAFSVEVSNGDDGKPVLDSADRVIGIAEPTAQHGVQGVGFAVPIASACQAVPC